MSPAWCGRAALEEKWIKPSEYESLTAAQGARKGVYVGGKPVIDKVARCRYSNSIFTALDDRDVIGTCTCGVVWPCLYDDCVCVCVCVRHVV